MDIKMNYLVAVGLILFTIITCIVLLVRNSRKDTVLLRKEYRTIWDVVEMIKDYFLELLSADIVEDTTDEEFDKLYRRVAKIRAANKNATFGMDAAKSLIKDIIAGAIDNTLLDSEIDNILGMRPGQIPSTHCMFEAIMQNYKLRYGKSALSQWINNYKLAEPHIYQGQKRYYISIEDVYQSYIAENIQFSRREKVKLLATLVYQLYKGHGIIDTLREMNIDGLNIGTSGSILNNLEGNTLQKDVLKPEEEATRGCWLYYKGRYIHLRFMNFGSAEEIQRIVNLLVRYNSSGTLTAKRGYMVNTMYDKSRLLAFRPPVAEYWAAFIRKFTLSSITLDSLICKDNVNNAEFARDTIKYLMWGLITTLITGRQGSGKTTLMSAMIEHVDPVYNIRILEMSPELYLRELYKNRNILSAQETQYVSASEIQNAFKKSDSAMSVCGEIASSSLACRWLEFGRVASIMNLATHHANTTKDLVIALANNLVDELHTTIDAAIQQVIDLLKIDIHLDYTKEGFRYIERISEVVPVNTDPYIDFVPEMPSRDAFDDSHEYEIALREYDLKIKEYNAKLNREYYTRVTDRESFRVNQLLHFDLKTMTYVADNAPTDALCERMKRNMSEQQIKEFDTYLLEHYKLREVDDLTIDLTDGIEENVTDDDISAADALLSELTGNLETNPVEEGLIDMADAIDKVRHTGNYSDDGLEELNYTTDENGDILGIDAIDKLVSIDAEESAKAHSSLYGAYEHEDDFEAVIEQERRELGQPEENIDFEVEEEKLSHNQNYLSEEEQQERDEEQAYEMICNAEKAEKAAEARIDDLLADFEDEDETLASKAMVPTGNAEPLTEEQLEDEMDRLNLEGTPQTLDAITDDIQQIAAGTFSPEPDLTDVEELVLKDEQLEDQVGGVFDKVADILGVEQEQDKEEPKKTGLFGRKRNKKRNKK